MERDSGDDDSNRILHTTDASSSQANPASVEHVSKGSQLKKRAKEILHINNPRTKVTEPAHGVTLAPSPKPTEMPHRLDDHPPDEGIHGIKDFVHQPVQTIKAKAVRKTNREVAGNVSTAEVSHAHDVELILAQDHMEKAQTEEERSSAHQDLEVLKRARQDLFVRWTMDRHVLKIRQLEKKPFLHKGRTEFMTKDESGQHKMDWKAYGSHLALLYAEKYGGQYIGSSAEPPPASQETISAGIERMLVASTPWQEVIMHIRRIYRWDNANETLTYFIIFLILWAIDCVASAIVSTSLSCFSHSRIKARTASKDSAPCNHRSSLTAAIPYANY